MGNIKDKKKIRELMVSLDMDTSIKVETLADFKKRSQDQLHQQILKEAIIISDKGKYFEELMK